MTNVAGGKGDEAGFRAPAVPLVCHDPYFCVFSFADNLTDGTTRHWTGSNNTLAGLIRVDGVTFRYLGAEPGAAAAARQMGMPVILPTRTIYRFEAGGVGLTLTFTTPALPGDLDLLSRPVTYVSWSAGSIDGKSHAVSIYFDVQADMVVDTPRQKVVWHRFKMAGMSPMRMGTESQDVLSRCGDDLRIDWGYLYHVVPEQAGASDAMGYSTALRESFAAGGGLPADDDLRQPRTSHDQSPVMAVAFDLGKVEAGRTIERYVLLAYDDLFAIEYFHRKLPAYWRRDGMGFDKMLRAAVAEYPGLAKRCEQFDEALMGDLRTAGGEKYARLCALAYRQCLAAHKLVADVDGTPLYFSKENYSNGCIATVDVTYPSSPFFLLLQPRLLEGQLTPIFEYARGPRWKFPFAPHDLGTYPMANGQAYGGGEESERDQMPVEECGNMLLMTGALIHVTGNVEYAKRYWEQLRGWADYLVEKGFDPENQLCTDDFAGHMAHNANLSIKAILGIGAFAMLCEKLGLDARGRRYRQCAEKNVALWLKAADDGDHYRLAFDKPGTWSQKYNLVWDRLLGLKLFPEEVARKETAFYRKKQGDGVLPLDSRKTYTKLDWTVWSAILSGDEGDFRALVEPLYRWANESVSRVPLTDWFETIEGGKQVGFQARSTVGGIFIKLLDDAGVWKKWVDAAK